MFFFYRVTIWVTLGRTVVDKMIKEVTDVFGVLKILRKKRLLIVRKYEI